MKKFIAIVLAALCILSVASVAAFADTATYTCEFCDATFANYADYKTHIDNYNAVKTHVVACPNEGCNQYFLTKAASEAHAKVCPYTDTRSDFQKAVDYLKAGEYGKALKIFANLVITFVKSDDFKKIVDKVTAFVKGIDVNEIKSTVEGVINKIPVDKIKDLVAAK